MFEKANIALNQRKYDLAKKLYEISSDQIRTIALLFFLMSNMLGCSSQQNTVSSKMEEEFQSIFPSMTFNESFQLDVYSDENIFKSGPDIPLIFTNKSPHQILFPTDSFIRLFIIRDDEWLEIDNKNTYSGLLILDPEGTPLMDFNVTGVRPAIDNFGTSKRKVELLRILMIGESIENNIHTGKLVGAYVDVYIRP